MRVRAALALVAVLALSACGTQPAGSAAIVGDTRISESDLSAEVDSVLAAQGRTPEQASPGLMITTLDRRITTELVDQLAEREGIVVDEGEIDSVLAIYAERAGGAQEFQDYLVGQDVAPDQIPGIIRLNLQVEKLGQIFAPEQTPEVQSLAVFQSAAQLSQEIGVDVSPRYGTWDAANLAVGPLPDDLATRN